MKFVDVSITASKENTTCLCTCNTGHGDSIRWYRIFWQGLKRDLCVRICTVTSSSAAHSYKNQLKKRGKIRFITTNAYFTSYYETTINVLCNKYIGCRQRFHVPPKQNICTFKLKQRVWLPFYVVWFPPTLKVGLIHGLSFTRNIVRECTNHYPNFLICHFKKRSIIFFVFVNQMFDISDWKEKKNQLSDHSNS